MKQNLNLSIEELISSTIKKSISEAFRNEKLNAKKATPINKVGGIELAMEITGLAKATIYAKTSNNTIPFFKKGKKVYFRREELTAWLEEGNNNSKAPSNEN